ncbi:MAG: TetR/AcrR family transcriptional regulator [Chitinophagales bacterium]|jgi:AcrR family transcriptional regulator|nr:TetR/AcrR family transcriptional regulator [Chitinophagales bacterium]
MSANIWILAGYEAFATEGKSGLVIERMAKAIGKNKSSFYHYFGEMELFLEALMTHHIHQSHCIAEKENKAESLDPELIDILLEHKIDLLFNRQLRFYQHEELFSKTLKKSNEIIGFEFVKLWKNQLEVSFSLPQLIGLFDLIIENFFLKINPDNITRPWLQNYFEQINKTILSLER